MPEEVINYTINSTNVERTVKLLNIRESMLSGKTQNVKLILDYGNRTITENLFSPIFEALSKLNIICLSIKIINDEFSKLRDIFNPLCNLSSLEHLSIECANLESIELYRLAYIHTLKVVNFNGSMYNPDQLVILLTSMRNNKMALQELQLPKLSSREEQYINFVSELIKTITSCPSLHKVNPLPEGNSDECLQLNVMVRNSLKNNEGKKLEKCFYQVNRAINTITKLNNAKLEGGEDDNLSKIIQKENNTVQNGLELATTYIDKIEDMHPNAIYWLEKILRSCGVVEHSLRCLKVIALKDKVIFSKTLYDFTHEALLSGTLKESNPKDKSQVTCFVLPDESDDKELLKRQAVLTLVKMQVEFQLSSQELEERLGDRSRDLLEILSRLTEEYIGKNAVSFSSTTLSVEDLSKPCAMVVTLFNALRDKKNRGILYVYQDNATQTESEVERNNESLDTIAKTKQFP